MQSYRPVVPVFFDAARLVVAVRICVGSDYFFLILPPVRICTRNVRQDAKKLILFYSHEDLEIDPETILFRHIRHAASVLALDTDWILDIGWRDIN